MISENNLAPLTEQSVPEKLPSSQALNSGAKTFIRYNKRIIHLGTPEYEEFRRQKNEFQRQWRLRNPDKKIIYEKTAWKNNRAGRTASNRKWVAKNKEKVAAKKKEWFAANRQKLNILRKRKYSDPKMREKILNAQKESRKRNGHKWNERIREARKKNPEIHRAYGRKQYRRNPSIFKVAARARTAKLRGAPVGNIKRIAAWENRWRHQDSITCYWCLNNFKPSDCQMEHMIPLSRQGAHAIENLCVSCKSCNGYKSGKSLSHWNSLINQPLLQLGEFII